MKSDNTVVIHGWMCNELGLKGNELLVFALIYGFSQDGVSSFYGGRKYIADTFNISMPTVDKALSGLIIKELICKEEHEGTTDVYFSDDEGIKKLYKGYKETLQGGVKKLYRGCKETLHNNINNNKNINNTISKDIVGDDTTFSESKKSKKKNLYEKCMDMIGEYTNNAMLWEYLSQFLKICLENSRESGRPFYQNMWKSKLTKLLELSDNTDTQIKIVKQTLDNGWVNFYEYKGGKKKTGNVAHDIEHLYGGMNERADKRCTDGEKF